MSAVNGGAQAATPDVGDERLSYRGVFQRLLIRPEIGAAIAAIAIWVFFWAVSRPFGLTGGTAGILDVSSTLGIMAVAVAMLMIGGEFDLSAGAATGALGIVTILLVRDVAGDAGGYGLSLWVALPISLCIALYLGWLNGTMVNRTSLPSFIVTLASFFVLKGAKLGYSKLIVDQIQVGKMDDLKINAELNGGSDRGYAFFDRIFAAEWQRNLHQWESRDAVYTTAVLLGLSLVVLAIYELNFARKAHQNPIGLVGFVGGVVAAIGGVLYLHNTDGSGGDTVGAIIIGVGMLVGFVGFAAWRYEPLASRGTFVLDASALVPIGAGLAALIAAIVFARVFDAESQQSVSNMVDGGAAILPFLGLAIISTGIHLYLVQKGLARARAIQSWAITFVHLLVAWQLDVLSLMTEQGLRAILFVGFGLGGGLSLLIAVNRAGRDSQAMRSTFLAVTALATAGMAFFVRAESESPKFRAQVFSIMLAIAALMFIWAVATLRHGQRRHADHAADRRGVVLAAAGAGIAVIGLIVRLLYTTAAEIADGIPPAKFSVRIIWFIAFAAGCTWLLGRTRFGSWTFAVGGNKIAARQVGVPAARTKTQLFMLVSFAAWLVGVLLAFRLNTIQASTGDGLEFEYIIAAVVGGTMLTGGYGSAMGAAIGAVIMAMSTLGIPNAGWNSDWRFVFLGAILLLAVIANNFIRSKAESAR